MMTPFRRAAHELAALETTAPAAPLPPAAAPPPPPAPPAEDHTHLKFSDVLRQGTPGTFKPLSHAELSAARKNHRDILGRDPPLADRHSDAQLAALHAWLSMRPGGRMPLRMWTSASG